MADSKVSVPLLAWGIVLLVGGTLVGSALFFTGAGKELSYNERSAILVLRKIADAEKLFRDADLDDNGVKDYWTIDLAGLAAQKKEADGKEVALLPAALGRADPRPKAKPAKAPAPFCGYHFAAVREGAPDEDDPATHPTRFAFCAYPADYGKSGRETFLIDERGIVHSYDAQGKWPEAWPSQAEPVTRIIDE